MQRFSFMTWLQHSPACFWHAWSHFSRCASCQFDFWKRVYPIAFHLHYVTTNETLRRNYAHRHTAAFAPVNAAAPKRHSVYMQSKTRKHSNFLAGFRTFGRQRGWRRESKRDGTRFEGLLKAAACLCTCMPLQGGKFPVLQRLDLKWPMPSVYVWLSQRLRIEGVNVEQLFKEIGLLDDSEIDAVSRTTWLKRSAVYPKFSQGAYSRCMLCVCMMLDAAVWFHAMAPLASGRSVPRASMAKRARTGNEVQAQDHGEGIRWRWWYRTSDIGLSSFERAFIINHCPSWIPFFAHTPCIHGRKFR